MDDDRHIARAISSLNTWWSVVIEGSFQSALEFILQRSSSIVFERVEYRDGGEVFGRPDIVELNIILCDGEVLACEFKAWVSKNDLYSFWQKVKSYESRFNRKVNRALLMRKTSYLPNRWGLRSTQAFKMLCHNACRFSRCAWVRHNEKAKRLLYQRGAFFFFSALGGS